jgi:hypothetical protein
MSSSSSAKESEDLRVIDMEFAMQQTMEDKEFLTELLQDMLKDEEAKCKEMQDGVEENDHTVSDWINLVFA